MGQPTSSHRLGPLATQRLSLAQRERSLLQGSPSDLEPVTSSWGNLGLWREGCSDYASACEALARSLAAAAGLFAGAEVLSLACGAGDELQLWRRLGAASVLGVEAHKPWTQLADVAHGNATRLHDVVPLQDRHFDFVFCIDAAYHFHPQQDFLRGAWQCLRPGGVLAYHQLVLEGERPRPLLQACARLCGVVPAGLQTASSHQRALEALGFEGVTVQRLDEAVLGGFVRHVRRREAQLGYAAWQRAWCRPAVTARLIPPCRAAGLGYALWVARKSGVNSRWAML